MDKKTEALKLADQFDLVFQSAPADRPLERVKVSRYQWRQLYYAIREALMSVPDGDQSRSDDEQPAQEDPCPGCRKGGVCKTPKCGRLKLPADHPFRSEQPAQQQEPVKVGRITANVKDMVLRQEVMLYTDDYLPIGTAIYTSQPASKPWVGLVHEETHEAIGTAGVNLLKLAKLWSDNKIHVYQFDNEARKIIEAVLRRASAKLQEKNA